MGNATLQVECCCDIMAQLARSLDVCFCVIYQKCVLAEFLLKFKFINYSFKRFGAFKQSINLFISKVLHDLLNFDNLNDNFHKQGQRQASQIIICNLNLLLLTL